MGNERREGFVEEERERKRTGKRLMQGLVESELREGILVENEHKRRLNDREWGLVDTGCE